MKQLVIPIHLQKRAAELIINGIAGSERIPKLDRQLHDVLCDYADKKRVFDEYHPEPVDMQEYSGMNRDELIHAIHMLCQGHDVITIE